MRGTFSNHLTILDVIALLITFNNTNCIKFCVVVLTRVVTRPVTEMFHEYRCVY
jgi:hypothetical protein